MNKKCFWLFATIAFVLSGFTISCSKDDSDVENKMFPEYSTMSFPASGGSHWFSVMNSSNASLSVGDDWITVYQSSTDHYQINVKANTGSARETYIQFTKNSSYLKIIVKQDGANNTGGGNTGGGNTGGGNTGGGNTGGGNTGGGNTGGGNTGGGNTGGGNTGGGTTQQVPAAPTGLTASPEGPSSYPYANLRWNASSGATSYIVYRATSAYGSYSQLATTSTSAYTDQSVKYGNTYYYKVKAKNSVGTSDFSNYAECDFKDKRKPGPVQYGNCTVSGTSMTIRWSVPTGATYGTPTKAILRVKNPDSNNYGDLQTLPGTATSATFTYTPWVDKNGYVYVGVILENENGSGGGTPKIYDSKNKKWIN